MGQLGSVDSQLLSVKIYFHFVLDMSEAKKKKFLSLDELSSVEFHLPKINLSFRPKGSVPMTGGLGFKFLVLFDLQISIKNTIYI